MLRVRLALATVSLLGVLALTACAGGRQQTAAPPAANTEPPATASQGDSLRSQAEGRLLPDLSPALAEMLRAQPWFQQMTPAHYSLISAIAACERAAGPRGEKQSVIDAFSFATEQPWYEDGLDEKEATGLRGIFQTYAESLSDQRAPRIGPVLASTIKYELVNVMQLPESGEMVLLVSADDPVVGHRALDIASETLPKIEALVGKFPYKFLHITVTDLPELYAGLSYDEFIALAPDSVDLTTIAHELTHSTLYGIFPTWFEEGFAYFMGYYMNGDLPEQVQEATSGLASIGIDTRLNVGPRPGYDGYQYYVDISTGFLFMNGLYEANGIDAVSQTIRAMRTKTFSDQELIRTLVQSGSPDEQKRVKDFVCKDVIGTTHNYCPPDSIY